MRRRARLATQEAWSKGDPSSTLENLADFLREDLLSLQSFANRLPTVPRSLLDTLTESAARQVHLARVVRPMIDVHAARMHGADPGADVLGDGGTGSVYLVNDHTVVKVLHQESAGAVNDEVVALATAEGIGGCQQLIAHSDTWMVSPRVPGLPTWQLDRESPPPYTDVHVAGLIDTTLALCARSLNSDRKGENLLWDAAVGFGVIDLERSVHDIPDWEHVLRCIIRMARPWRGHPTFEAQVESQFARVLLAGYPGLVADYMSSSRPFGRPSGIPDAPSPASIVR